MTKYLLIFAGGAVVGFVGAYWHASTLGEVIDPAAGRLLPGRVPDPNADYMPENRHIPAEQADELRRMFAGK